jgi:hypothetical protein
MSLETDVQSLTNATTDLLVAVNVGKATLDERVVAATAAQTAAAGSAAAANTSAGNASGAAANALAIYATAAAQQAALSNAQAAASVAQGFAASAASVVQQDLSGVNAAALHRSPNAVTAMFLYDTSKDSDGGAWTEKCQHTSWFNEAVTGKWLGAQRTEADARYEGATLGSELLVNGSFDTDTSWTKSSGITIADGKAVYASPAHGNNLQQATAFTAGNTYRVTVVASSHTSGRLTLYANYTTGTTTTVAPNVINSVGTFSYVFTAGSNGTGFSLQADGASSGACIMSIDSVSVKQITALNTTSNDYFQLSTDGKFYRLWKNRLSATENFASAYWSASNVTPTSFTGTLPTGVSTVQTLTDASAAAGYFVRYSGTLTTQLTASLSIPIRKTTGTPASFPCIKLATQNGTNGSGAVLNTTTGTAVAAISGVGGSNTNVTPTITVVSDGDYWRFGITATSPSDGPWVSVLVIPAYNADGSGTVNAATTGSIVAGGIQVEDGGITTYEPKLDLTGTTSEVFRGNKRKFPKLAGIVAESGSGSVTIYDLTEPGRPMWMRFTASSAGGLFSILMSGPTAVAAQNGVMCIGQNGAGVGRIDFAKDDVLTYSTPLFVLAGGNIAKRNIPLSRYVLNSSINLASTLVNAVAMTVLPDAPVDPVTGLKVPTIAVATNGGTSIIRHNGTVFNPTWDGKATFSALVSFDPAGNLVDVGTPGGGTARVVRSWNGISTVAGYFSSIQFGADRPHYSPILYPTIRSAVATKGALGLAADNFLSLMKVRRDSQLRSLSGYLTNTFNTGYMVGDIRRAYLADVDTGSVSGAELVVNGTFDTDTAWAKYASTISGGTVNFDGVTSVTASIGLLTQTTPAAVTAGKLYAITYSITSDTGNLISVGFGGSAPGVSRSAVGTYTDYVVAPSGTVNVVIITRGSVGIRTGSIDNISVKEVVADRSYKAQAAATAGTLTKSQVASAAQLVAYSGFSAANYLREPYSADLDFGTGEWSVGAWVNVPAVLPVGSFPLVGSQTAADNLGAAPWAAPGAGSVSGGTWSGMSQYAPMNVFGAFTTGKFYLFNITVTAQTGNFAVLGVDGSVVYKQLSVGTHTMIARATAVSLALLSQSVGGSITISQFRWQEVDASLIADRAHSSGAKISLGINAGGFLTATAFDGTTTRTVTTTAAYNTATWLKARANYTTDGSLAISVNGVEVAVTRGNPLLTLNNSNAVLTIGNSFALDAPFPGSIALLKASATVPTAEQMVWMYEQEKQMFRDGAQVTLPDAGGIADLTYDDATDKWMAVSPTNESEWSGLVRTSVTPSPAGSYSKITATSGVQLQARTNTNPGVDITIPAYGLREELLKDGEDSARVNAQLAVFDYVGGFTATTVTGNTAITSVAALTYPVSYIGARVSGSGIPADTFVAAVVGTTVYLTKAATASASAVAISFNDFILPTGMEAKVVSLAGVAQREGATAQFTRLFDGFKETIRFGTAPSNTALIQIQAARSAA